MDSADVQYSIGNYKYTKQGFFYEKVRLINSLPLIAPFIVSLGAKIARELYIDDCKQSYRFCQYIPVYQSTWHVLRSPSIAEDTEDIWMIHLLISLRSIATLTIKAHIIMTVLVLCILEPVFVSDNYFSVNYLFSKLYEWACWDYYASKHYETLWWPKTSRNNPARIFTN